MPSKQEIQQDIYTRLFSMKDEAYKAFNKKLIPTVDEECMIGIRTPELRKFAKTFFKTAPESAALFMQTLPHRYFEENNLHAFLIECIQDIEKAVSETEKLLPFIDNWATCDLFSPRIFKKHPDILYRHILRWIRTDRCYTVRYAIGLLLSNYLDRQFRPEMLDLVADTVSDEYYVKMMAAWYFSVALVKQYDTAVRFIETKRLDTFTHNKAIQKAIESKRISAEKKAYLKTLKIYPDSRNT